MATAEYEKSGAPATVTLVLTEEEARYVHSALYLVDPLPFSRFGEEGHDPVYDALCRVLAAASLDANFPYAQSNQ